MYTILAMLDEQYLLLQYFMHKSVFNTHGKQGSLGLIRVYACIMVCLATMTVLYWVSHSEKNSVTFFGHDSKWTLSQMMSCF